MCYVFPLYTVFFLCVYIGGCYVSVNVLDFAFVNFRFVYCIYIYAFVDLQTNYMYVVDFESDVCQYIAIPYLGAITN